MIGLCDNSRFESILEKIKDQDSSNNTMKTHDTRSIASSNVDTRYIIEM
jgi:hypothetical protein